jgi:LemA protein
MFTIHSLPRMRSLLAAVVLGLAVSGCGYNTIPTAEEQAKAKWADVQNNYQRRADLIPNLVATVQGYAKQEREVLTAVVEARAKATQVRSTRHNSPIPRSSSNSRMPRIS